MSLLPNLFRNLKTAALLQYPANHALPTNTKQGRMAMGISAYRFVSMKHIVCTALFCLSLVGNLQAAETPAVMKFSIEGIRCVAFSPDGKHILTTGDNGMNRATQIWDAESKEKLHKFAGHVDVLMSAAFSPDGKKVASIGYDTTIIWDTEAGKELRRLGDRNTNTNSSGGFDVAFSPDGKLIATAGGGGISRIWDVESGKKLYDLIGHNGGVNSISFSPDGKQVVTTSFDGTARTWDADSGQQRHKFVVWDRESGANEQDVNARDSIPVYSAAFSPDGERIVTAAGAVALNVERRVIIWDAESGKELQKVIGHGRDPGGHNISVFVYSVAFSPDGKKFVTAGGDRTARVWDAESGKELQKLVGHNDDVYSAAFSPDGKKVVTAGRDAVRIWDLERYIDPTLPIVRPAILDF